MKLSDSLALQYSGPIHAELLHHVETLVIHYNISTCTLLRLPTIFRAFLTTLESAPY